MIQGDEPNGSRRILRAGYIPGCFLYTAACLSPGAVGLGEEAWAESYGFEGPKNSPGCLVGELKEHRAGDEWCRLWFSISKLTEAGGQLVADWGDGVQNHNYPTGGRSGLWTT